MIKGQARIDFGFPPRKVRKVQFFVWQPEIFEANPWCICYDGYTNGRCDITIYHSAIPKGQVTFTRLNLETHEKFSSFCTSMLRVYQGFGGLLKVRTQDVIAMEKAYRQGVA